jgi:hypothetical protein
VTTKIQGQKTKKPRKSYNTENLTNAGKGRPKGAQNKTTALLKDAILQAAEAAGREIGQDGKPTGKGGMVEYLTKQANENPGPFLSLLGKVLPMQIAGTDENGEAKELRISFVGGD